jgi:GTPase Era involved in 16S rRNA processing
MVTPMINKNNILKKNRIFNLKCSSDDDNLGFQKTPFKSGFVSILGNPNVGELFILYTVIIVVYLCYFEGKSTLMNALLNETLSIVSPKPQTTRHRILGVLTEKDYQIIFSDTPGMMLPAYKLQEAMMDSVNSFQLMYLCFLIIK